MIHLHVSLKFRIFGRDITRCSEEWAINLGLPVPLPKAEHVRWSRFGFTVILATS